MKKFITLFILAVLFGSQNLIADEGMWMINALDKALEKNMKKRGLKLSAREIYNADAEGATISDAIVSMEFGCTGSMISENGLLITNHHCAYGDVHALSTPEHNYLEEGFWAMKSEEEVNIKGKTVYYLKKVLDVTDEVNALKEEYAAQGKKLGGRKMSYIMETKYNKESGMETMFSSMWSGSKYYMAFYEVYKDVRLVAAPPVSSAAYGGDTDNWEWPQHKCDFAMYRVYTAPDGSPATYSKDNVPMKPKATLKISLDGYKAGDYAMVIGYPGRTNRYSSSYETDFNENIKLPISNRLRGEQMDIIEKWMNIDPQVRLLYADYYFGLSNVQKLYGGEVQCFGRFDVVGQKAALEEELQAWIEASPERKQKWGNLLNDLKAKYIAVIPAQTDINYYRESLIRGTRFSRVLGKVMAYRNEVLLANGIKPKRGAALLNGPDPVEEECCRTKGFCPKSFTKLYEGLVKEYEIFDLRVEKELFAYAVKQFFANVSEEMLGEYQKEVRDQQGSNVAEYLWENSFLTDMDRLEKFMAEEHTVAEMFNDPVYRFFKDVEILTFNKRIIEIEGKVRISDLEREFTHALYQMRLDKGIVQYPDANSTMRLTYGTVGGFNPRNAVYYDWKSEPVGILEKYDPENYEFRLNDRQYLLYKKADWGRWGFGKNKDTMYVNFLTDCDITGGNSGSPVLNAKGEIIGLAFDGNKESLASDMWYTPDYNKCVCVDIRFILWTLDKYAGMTRIIEELGL